MKAKSTLLPVLALMLAFSFTNAGAIKAIPGRFDHFVLSLPEKIIAGEGVVIKITAQDAHNNLISGFPEAGKEFKVSVSGSGVVQPAHLTSKSFQGGVASFTVTSRKAGKVMLYIDDLEEAVPVLKKEIVVLPGKLDHFLVVAPGDAVASKKIETKIIARDVLDNTINDIEIKGRDISIEPSGTADVGISGIAVSDFKNGMGSVLLSAEKQGRLAIVVKDISTGSKGQSNVITVRPASAVVKTTEPVKTVKEAQKKQPRKIPVPPPLTAKKAPEPAKKTEEPLKTVSAPPVNRKTKKDEFKKPENSTGRRLFEVDDISIIEAEGKALLVISSASPVETVKYKNIVETRQGREWLKIKIMPAARKTDTGVNLKSEIVGEVRVEDDKNELDAVNIHIELMTERPFLDISSHKNALVVMLSKVKP